jgi:transcriptional regulator with XRE-family HTH domain
MYYYSTIEAGKRIKQLRKEHKLTQEQLAEKIGVSARQVRAFESGENGASIDVLVALTEFFDTSLDYLVMGRPTPIEVKKRLNAMLEEFSEMVKSVQ